MRTTLPVLLLSLTVGALSPGASGQRVIASATADAGSAYPVFATAGFGIEGPDDSSSDCQSGSADDAGNHKDFGAHILQQADAELARNVFAFVSHIEEDSDRCLVQDRVRIEVKGGPQGSSVDALEHSYGDTSFYRWAFRLDEGFVGSGSFTHLFQNKAQGGTNTGQPILTLTARRDDLEVVYNKEDNGSNSQDLAAVSLSKFRGRWVEVYMRQVHREAGLLEIQMGDVLTGAPILNYLNADIDLWREAATSGTINRPKWGVYRSRREGLRDEVVLFGDICSSETAAEVCPSLLPTANGAPAAATDLAPIDGAKHVPTVMPFKWDGSPGATSYNVYFGTDAEPALATTTTDTTYAAELAAGTTYYYQIGAVNDAGETRTVILIFTTLAAEDAGGWEVARGHAAPHVERAEYFELNTNLEIPPAVSETVAVEDEAGNAAYAYFSAEKEGSNGNYRWRYRQESGEATTLLLRVAPLEGANNIAFVEFYGLGWRQKVRLNRSTAKFERTPEDPEFEFPEDFWEDGEFRLLRFTFAPSADGANMLTTLYLDEATDAFASGLSDEEKSSNYLDIGRAGSTNYGAIFDYIAVNPTGAFAPDDETAPALPADLFTGGGGENGAPAAVTGLLPLNGATDVPLTMPIRFDGAEAATAYNVYLGTDPQPALAATISGTTYYDTTLQAGTTYYYRVGAANDNGESLSDVRSFTTLAVGDDGSWNVARGHARPDVENPGDFELDTNLDIPAALDTVVAVGTDGNRAFGYLSEEKEGSAGNYRFRYRQNADNETTLVLRAAPLPDNGNLFYVEIYGLGWRQKIRLNTSTAKFEKTPDDPEFEFPEGYWQADTFRTLRFTFEGEGGNLMTKLYLDDATEAFGEGLSDEEKDGAFLDVGRAGGTNYGAYFDYIAVNETGAFAPGDAAMPALPADLIVPEIVVGLTDARAIERVRVHPNPVGERLRIGGGGVGRGDYQIITATGQVALRGEVSAGADLSVAVLPQGTYLLRVTDADGTLSVARFVKL